MVLRRISYYATMAIATFEQELLQTPHYTNHSSESQHRKGPSFSELLGILNYNQGLVEFADSKAGSLILLNSLLIAAVGALPSNGNLGYFKLASVVLCSAAVYVCFQVISSKDSNRDSKFSQPKKSAENWEKNDFLFFGCIQKHKSGDEFCRAFGESDDDSRRRSILQRTYIISKIAGRKFAQYKTAQQMTSVALVVWVAANLVPFV